MSSSFIHVVASVTMSFLRLNNIPHLVYPFLHTWTLGLFHLLAVVSNAAVNMEIHLSKMPLAVLLGIYPAVKLLYHMAILVFIF